jgi:CDP-paratose 2-epimerase
MKAHYPGWDITQSLENTIGQIVEAWKKRTEE